MGTAVDYSPLLSFLAFKDARWITGNRPEPLFRVSEG